MIRHKVTRFLIRNQRFLSRFGQLGRGLAQHRFKLERPARPTRYLRGELFVERVAHMKRNDLRESDDANRVCAQKEVRRRDGVTDRLRRKANGALTDAEDYRSGAMNLFGCNYRIIPRNRFSFRI